MVLFHGSILWFYLMVLLYFIFVNSLADQVSVLSVPGFRARPDGELPIRK